MSMKTKRQVSAKMFKILSNETRLAILCELVNNSNICVTDIAERLQMEQSAISHQLARLEARNIIESTRDGRNVCYKITQNPEAKLVISLIKACNCS